MLYGKTIQRFLARLREAVPDIEFTTDIIVGFPGESEEDFAATLDIAEKIGLYHIHIFPYSDRRGTEAASMKDKLPAEVKNERFDRLNALAERLA